MTAERNAEMAALYVSGRTLQSIGSQFGVTRERVRQIVRGLGVLAEHGGCSVAAERRRAEKEDARRIRCIAKYGMPPDHLQKCRRHYRAFRQQRATASIRGIGWHMSFAEWLGVWERSGKLDQRGRAGDSFVMSRKGDAGDYEVDNVVIKTLAENSREAVEKWRGKTKAHKGVYELYPGSPRPFVAKLGRKQVGPRFETAEAAAAFRAQAAA